MYEVEPLILDGFPLILSSVVVLVMEVSEVDALKRGALGSLRTPANKRRGPTTRLRLRAANDKPQQALLGLGGRCQETHNDCEGVFAVVGF